MVVVVAVMMMMMMNSFLSTHIPCCKKPANKRMTSRFGTGLKIVCTALMKSL